MHLWMNPRNRSPPPNSAILCVSWVVTATLQFIFAPIPPPPRAYDPHGPKGDPSPTVSTPPPTLHHDPPVMDLICAPLRGWGWGGGGVVNCDMSQKIQ